MKRRFCDRHAGRGESVEIQMTHVPNVQIVADGNEDGDGTVTDAWDLCETCHSLFQRFMDGRKLEGEGQ